MGRDAEAGPVAAGRIVLTMRAVFDDLFEALGERTGEHVTLVLQPVIARHFWRTAANATF